MYHLCTTATFRTIYHKRKILDIRLNIKDFSSVGVTGFEPATTRPPDVYSNRAELHPVGFRSANIVYFSQNNTFLQVFFLFLWSGCVFTAFRLPFANRIAAVYGAGEPGFRFAPSRSRMTYGARRALCRMAGMESFPVKVV